MDDGNAGQEAPITRERIAAAERVIRPYVRHTPIIEIDAAEFGLAPCRLLFKFEQLQHSGSFKVRGAFANLLLREVPEAGVIAASGGNHGAAVAYAARRLSVRATVFVPSITPPAKLINQVGSSPGSVSACLVGTKSGNLSAIPLSPYGP